MTNETQPINMTEIEARARRMRAEAARNGVLAMRRAVVELVTGVLLRGGKAA